MKNIEILYEDDLCLVINKPAGLAVQGGKDVKISLDDILREIREPAPLLVHRLDKDTSGLILAAKTKESAAYFAGLFSSNNKKIKKQYTAVCNGHLPQKEGVFLMDLLINNSLKKSQTIYKVQKEGKIILQDESEQEIKFSILEITLETGRMHQIRRHMAMNKTPVLGDDKYGDFKLNKKLQKNHGIKKLLLHASHLEINDKITINISSPLPDYFNIFLDSSMLI